MALSGVRISKNFNKKLHINDRISPNKHFIKCLFGDILSFIWSFLLKFLLILTPESAMPVFRIRMSSSLFLLIVYLFCFISVFLLVCMGVKLTNKHYA